MPHGKLGLAKRDILSLGFNKKEKIKKKTI
jgi:hypothetical protein